MSRNHVMLFGGIAAVLIAAVMGIVWVTGDEPAAMTTPAGVTEQQGSSGSGSAGDGDWSSPVYESPTPVRVVLPPGAVACSQSGSGRFSAAARGTEVTSCPFADAVRDAVRSTGDVFPRTVTAYSPVTLKAYEMRFTGGDLITCRGGNDAVVYVY